MHTIDDIKKYQSYGFHLIPMGMDKKPKTKRTGKNGKGSWKWDDKENKTFLKWSDDELLRANGLGVSHEPSSIAVVDLDAIDISPYASCFKPTFTIGKKVNNKLLNRALIYKVTDKHKSFSYPSSADKGQTIIELLTNTQSVIANNEKIIIRDVPPAEIDISELLLLTKTAAAFVEIERKFPKKGLEQRDKAWLRLAGALNKDTVIPLDVQKMFGRQLAENINDTDELDNRINKFDYQFEKLKNGNAKEVFGIPSLAEFLKANLPAIDLLKREVKEEVKSNPLVMKGLAEFVQTEYPPIISFLHPLVTTEQLTQVFALPGIGKSLFCMELAWKISQGLDFLDFKFNKLKFPTPPPVLYVEGEMAAATIQDRINTMVDRDTNENLYDMNNFYLSVLRDQPNQQYTSLIHEAGRERIEEAAERIFKQRGIKPIIFLDNIRCLMGNFDDKEAKEWISFMTWINKLRARDYTLWFLHHSVNTGEKASGSGMKEASLNMNIKLSRPKDEEALDLDEDTHTQIKIEFIKWREVHMGFQRPFIMSIDRRTMTWSKHPLLNKTQRYIKEQLSKGISVEDIIKSGKSGCSKANVYKVKKLLGDDETDKK